MLLKTYLDREKTSASALAAKLGVAHTTVSRWIHGGAFPAPDMLLKIEAETGGEVTANDFTAARAAQQAAE